MIDDEIVKAKILKYRNDVSDTTIDDIKNYIFEYTYSYPRAIFHANDERATNFYIYYMERFERILSSYEIKDTQFLTWFTCTLRTSYLNYIKQEALYNSKYNNKTGENLYLDHENFDASSFLIPQDKSENLEFIKKLDKYLRNKYTSLESLIFRMYYLEIFYQFVSYDIYEYFDISYEEVCAFIEEARATYLYKYQAFVDMQDKISTITLKIIELETKNADKDKLQKLRDKKKRYVTRLNQFQIVVPYAYLAEKFGTTTNKIAKIMAKIRKDIKSDF